MRYWARAIKSDLHAIWIAARDPRVPWYAKASAAAVVAYALSPIDLIPDFIPVLGYLDDLVIVPAGIMLTVRLIPSDLLSEFRALAQLPNYSVPHCPLPSRPVQGDPDHVRHEDQTRNLQRENRPAADRNDRQD